MHQALREQLAEALNTAVKEQDKRRLGMLRLVNAAIRDRDEADRREGRDPTGDEEIIRILSKMMKQREESARAHEEAGRLDIAERERDEIAIIADFLPAQLDSGEMEQVCREVVEETDSKSLRDVGRCMLRLKERYRGQMDFCKASTMVKGLLS
ncbi:GatB/YqeY domain-containing protein [Consotaella salsifontis]|nr:GatB/YqeY domain-containing protein [Consotaella salsifontis]